MSAKAKTDVLLSKALSLADGEVVQLAFDPLNAKRSCTDGLSYLEKRAERLLREHPGFDLEGLRALPELCDRVSAMQHEVDKARGARTAGVVELVDEALAWRRRLMSSADSLVVSGKVDGKELAKIRAGTGRVDHLRDVIDLITLLAPHDAAVAAVFGADALEQAGLAANEALTALGYGPNDPEVTRMAADLRDRYATLVVRGHDRLRSAVSALSTYKNAGEVVTSLANRTASKARVTPDPVDPPSV